MEKSIDAPTISSQIKARISDIEEELRNQQVLSDELDRLRQALALLDGGTRPRVVPARAREESPAPKKSRATPTAAETPTAVSARAPRGHNRAKILEALKGGPMTASDVSKKTGIRRSSASTALGSMAMCGEVVKAARGYTLPT